MFQYNPSNDLTMRVTVTRAGLAGHTTILSLVATTRPCFQATELFSDLFWSLRLYLFALSLSRSYKIVACTALQVIAGGKDIFVNLRSYKITELVNY